jgi:hypothetical protein
MSINFWVFRLGFKVCAFFFNVFRLGFSYLNPMV